MPGPATELAKRYKADLRLAPERIVRAALKEVDVALKATVRQDTGGDGRMSGMNNGRPGLSSKVTPGVIARAFIEPSKRTRGMWAILERGTQGHVIRAKRIRRGRVRPTTALHINDGFVQGPVVVRGARAKRTWTRGIQRSQALAVRAGREQFVRAA